MSRRLAGILCLLAIMSGGLTGCSKSMFGMGKSKPFGRSEQWEPEVTEDTKPTDWRSAPSNLRQGAARVSKEDPLDSLIWSDEARDINRSLGGSL